MSTTEQIERIRRTIEAARQRETLRAEALTARGPGPRAGDLYAPPVPLRAAVAVALTHLRGSREWFAVAADEFVAAGRADVIVPDAALWGPLSLRCGHGLWLDVAALADLDRVGMIPDVYAQEAARRLARLDRGEAEPTVNQEEAEDDPEYQEWIALVDADREALQRWRDGRGMVLRLVMFRPEAPAALSALPEERRPGAGHLMAASSGDLLGGLAEALGGGSPAVWRSVAAGSGELALRAGGAGVDVFWISAPGMNAAPPRLRGRSADGRTRSARWRAGGDPAYHQARPIFPWLEGKVTLLVGPDRGEKITVRQ